MTRILLLLLLIIPFTLLAKYKFDETLFIPIEQNGVWKKGKQVSSDNGSCLTNYLLKSESKNNWSKLLTIQFKDRYLVKGTTAEEAMTLEQQMSSFAQWKVIKGLPNDITYERTFPEGEHELVRMVMTKKGLHRAAYLKRGLISQAERTRWVKNLMNGVVGH